MPANDFEKQAKQLLDELKFRPNEEVWIQVEKRIREKKRRRWLILLPLLAGLAVGGYFIAEQYTKGNEQLVTTGTPGKTTATNEVIKEEPALKEENTNKENGLSEPVAKENNREEQTIPGDKEPGKSIVAVGKERNRSASIDISSKKVVESKFSQKQGKDIVAVVESPGQSNVVGRSKQEDAVTTNTNTETIPTKVNDQPADNNFSKTGEAEKPVANAVDKKHQAEINEPLTDPVAAVETAKKETKSKTKNKWQWGVLFSAGVSNINDQPFKVGDKQRVNYTPATITNAIVTLNTPSPQYNAFAMQAGIFAQKTISKRSSISVGLNYALYQTRIEAGEYYGVPVRASNFNQYSNAISAYSSLRPNKTYYSKLHYAEVPVNFSTQLNRSKKMPLYWETGVGAGFLVGSNYLHYDSAAAGVYIKDKNLLSKLNINLQTGLAISFFAQSKMPLKAGPYLQVGVRDLINTSSDKRYLYYGGLKLQWVIPGKRK